MVGINRMRQYFFAALGGFLFVTACSSSSRDPFLHFVQKHPERAKLIKYHRLTSVETEQEIASSDNHYFVRFVKLHWKLRNFAVDASDPSLIEKYRVTLNETEYYERALEASEQDYEDRFAVLDRFEKLSKEGDFLYHFIRRTNEFNEEGFEKVENGYLLLRNGNAISEEITHTSFSKIPDSETSVRIIEDE